MVADRWGYIEKDNVWYRKKDNDVLGDLVDFSRHESPDFMRDFGALTPYPGVIEITSAPVSGGTNWTINDLWWNYHREINTWDAWRALRRNNAGWINWAANQQWDQGQLLNDPPKEWPKIEGINTIGNYVKILEEKNKAYKIETFRKSDGPPDPLKVNPKTHPWLFSEMHSISRTGEIGYAPDGAKSYFALVTKKGFAWIPKAAIKIVDNIPQRETEMGLPSSWAYGIDISKYDKTFDRSKSERVIDFIIQRASYADVVKVVKDELFDQLLPNVQKVKRRLAYHYWSGHQSVNEQVDVFLSVVDGKGFHAYAADFETQVNPQTEASANGCLEFIKRVSQETGKRVLLYQQRHEWNKFKNNWQGVDIWPKYWPFETWLNTGFKATATVKKHWGSDEPEHWILQYGGDDPTVAGFGDAKKWGVGHGTSRLNVDLDVFNGTPEQMSLWLGLDSPPPLPPETDDEIVDETAIRRDEVERMIAQGQDRLAELG